MSALIRMARAEDVVAIRAIYAPHCESTAVSFETSVPPLEEMSRRIAAVQARLPWLVQEDAGDVVGYSYASPHHERAAYGWSVDAAIYVRDSHQGRGIGRSLYGALLQLLRRQGFFKVGALITVPNAASIALHVASGFTPVGIYTGIGYKFGAWRDVAHYQLTLQTQSGAPEPVKPIAELVDIASWSLAP